MGEGEEKEKTTSNHNIKTWLESKLAFCKQLLGVALRHT